MKLNLGSSRTPAGFDVLLAGRRGDGNADSPREPALLSGAASAVLHQRQGEGQDGGESDPGAGPGTSGRLQGEERGRRNSQNSGDHRQENTSMKLLVLFTYLQIKNDFL